jgi:hypothetical protein|tara:strand:- start:133 stop:414 length:282 start_codon:yes stop_codon:yes gene_type:complete
LRSLRVIDAPIEYRGGSLPEKIADQRELKIKMNRLFTVKLPPTTEAGLVVIPPIHSVKGTLILSIATPIIGITTLDYYWFYLTENIDSALGKL